MKVDTVAALQGAVNAREKHHVNPILTDQVKALMRKHSEPGVVGRGVFELEAFLADLAQIDFGSNRSQVARLLECLGESLSSGLIVASSEDNPKFQEQ